MGFHSAKFGLPRPFCFPVMSRHAIDGQTDGRTNGQTDRQTDRKPRVIYKKRPLPYGGGGIIMNLLLSFDLRLEAVISRHQRRRSNDDLILAHLLRYPEKKSLLLRQRGVGSVTMENGPDYWRKRYRTVLHQKQFLYI